MLNTEFKENQPIYFIKNNELFIIEFRYGKLRDYGHKWEVSFSLIKEGKSIYEWTRLISETKKNDLIGPFLRCFISLCENKDKAPSACSEEDYLFPSDIKPEKIDRRILEALQIMDEYYPNKGLSFTDLVVSVDAKESLVEKGLNRLQVRQIIKYEAGVFKIADYDKADEYLNKILTPITKNSTKLQYDLFICHASEDKDIVKPLVNRLEEKGFRVWYDEYVIKLGDSLRRTIDKGLASSRFGIVILSPHFFKKEWPQKELDALAEKEINGEKVILPIWHNITKKEVAQKSPLLATLYAAKTEDGLEQVVNMIIKAIQVD